VELNFYAGPPASRSTSPKTLRHGDNNRRLKLLNLPEENVSDLRAAPFVGTRATVNLILKYEFLIPKRFNGDDGALDPDISNCF
jgi:hypothetical protein